MKNWKTNLFGLLVIAAVGLHWAGLITVDQMTAGIGALTGAGFLVARDAKRNEE